MNTVKNKRVRRQKRSKFLTDLYAALIYAMFYIPVVVMIAFSFNDSKRNYAWTGFTTQWYGKLFSFGNHDLWESLVYSLVIAVLATIISVIIGVLGGIGLKKFEFRGKKFIGLMLYVPIVVPEIVLAVAMLIIFITVGVSLGMGTIIIGHCTFCIPYAVITIKGRISGDNETLQEASMDLGANRVQTFWRVTIPSIIPGIVSAAFLSFTLSIDDVVMSNMLARRQPVHPAGADPVGQPYRHYARYQCADHRDGAGDGGGHVYHQRDPALLEKTRRSGGGCGGKCAADAS